MNHLQLVLDTNVLLVSIGRQSKYNWLFQDFLNESYDLLVTTPILLEYHEQIALKTRPEIAENILKLILAKPNVIKVDVTYRWSIIVEDPDDNAFIDCAFSGNADYLVSNDKHFNILKRTDFPKIPLITLDAFQDIYFENR